jgi:hypothetical protein
VWRRREQRDGGAHVSRAWRRRACEKGTNRAHTRGCVISPRGSWRSFPTRAPFLAPLLYLFPLPLLFPHAASRALKATLNRLPERHIRQNHGAPDARVPGSLRCSGFKNYDCIMYSCTFSGFPPLTEIPCDLIHTSYFHCLPFALCMYLIRPFFCLQRYPE